MREYVALLRAIAHVPMSPFREALEELGFTDVASYGMSGNLLFNAEIPDARVLETMIGERLRAVPFVRTRDEVERIVGANPFRDDGASIMFLAGEIDAERRRAFEELEFEGTPPRIVGTTVYFVHPARPSGRKSALDFERILDVAGTARAARVVSAIAERMSKS